jgi:hypothetical protein
LTVKGWAGRVNFSTLNQGANVCVDTTIVDAPQIDSSPIGIVFWWQDWENFYTMYYWADGYVEVRRVVGNAESVLFGLESLALKKGVGQTNQIELDLKAKDATILINGTEVKRFRGVQPKDGGVIGVYAISPEDKAATFTYDNLIVSAPSQ